jgi:hypothetical protein
MTRVNTSTATLLLPLVSLLSSGAAFNQQHLPVLIGNNANTIPRRFGAWGININTNIKPPCQSSNRKKWISREILSRRCLLGARTRRQDGTEQYKAGVSATPVMQELIRYTTDIARRTERQRPVADHGSDDCVYG